MIRWSLVIVLALGTLGCANPESKTPEPSTEVPAASPVSLVATVSQDMLADALAANAQNQSLANAQFAEGEVTPINFDQRAIRANSQGFTIQMPSQTAIPTPTVYRGRLFVSGGFSSREFYCFDARSGAFLWGVQLSDDGPSTAVPYEDSIIFGTESCTLFALNIQDGTRRWANYLGDPMMSAPAIAGDNVVAAYPATHLESGAEDESTAEMEVPPDGKSPPPALERAYLLACFKAKNGELVWQRWIDGDCISAPVADADDIFVAILSGTLSRFRASDGTIVAARGLRAPPRTCGFAPNRSRGTASGRAVLTRWLVSG